MDLIKGAGLTGSACRKMQAESYPSLCTNLKCKWIKEHNTNPDTLKRIEDNRRNSIEYIGTEEHV